MGDIQPVNPSTPTFRAAQDVLCVVTPRVLTMHTVTDSELNTVASLSNSVDLGFFTGSGGVFATILITVFTVPLGTPALAAFVGSAVASGAATLFFGVRARISYKEAQRKLQEIKQGGFPKPPPQQ